MFSSSTGINLGPGLRPGIRREYQGKEAFVIREEFAYMSLTWLLSQGLVRYLGDPTKLLIYAFFDQELQYTAFLDK